MGLLYAAYYIICGIYYFEMAFLVAVPGQFLTPIQFFEASGIFGLQIFLRSYMNTYSVFLIRSDLFNGTWRLEHFAEKMVFIESVA